MPVDHFLIERLTKHVSRFSEPEPVSPSAQRRRRARGYIEPPGEGLPVMNRIGWPVLHTDFHQTRRLRQARSEDRASTLPARRILRDLGHLRPDTYAHPPLAVEEVTVTVFGTAFSHIGTPKGPPWQRITLAQTPPGNSPTQPLPTTIRRRTRWIDHETALEY
ncbi:hypothetical protein GCM10010451_38480 [Streptomyces virens]|uniref:Uncharacterized protein n=1 Tax=Streptomyces virens TaxID=285572 RepID=A0ABP6PQK6_9ACTN